MNPGTVWKQLLHNKRRCTLEWGACLIRAERWVRRKFQLQLRISMISWPCTDKGLYVIDLACAQSLVVLCLTFREFRIRNHMLRRRKVTSRHFVHIWFLSICWWLCQEFAVMRVTQEKMKIMNQIRHCRSSVAVLTLRKILINADTVHKNWKRFMILNIRIPRRRILARRPINLSGLAGLDVGIGRTVILCLAGRRAQNCMSNLIKWFASLSLWGNDLTIKTSERNQPQSSIYQGTPSLSTTSPKKKWWTLSESEKIIYAHTKWKIWKH